MSLLWPNGNAINVSEQITLKIASMSVPVQDWTTRSTNTSHTYCTYQDAWLIHSHECQFCALFSWNYVSNNIHSTIYLFE